MWKLYPDCYNIIKSSWDIPIFGCPMFFLSRKLQLLKCKLKQWNNMKFWNVQDNVRLAEDKISGIQSDINSNGYNDFVAD